MRSRCGRATVSGEPEPRPVARPSRPTTHHGDAPSPGESWFDCQRSRHWSTRQDAGRAATGPGRALFASVAALHAVGFGTLTLAVAPQHFHVGAQVFSVGLGITAYIFGLRHAFDADHIAAIDNATRKLTADGTEAQSVGFWFALGHSAMVVVLALLVVAAARPPVCCSTTFVDPPGPGHRRHAGLGRFLYLIAIVNLVALVGIGGSSPRAARAGSTSGNWRSTRQPRLLARILGPS